MQPSLEALIIIIIIIFAPATPSAPSFPPPHNHPFPPPRRDFIGIRSRLTPKMSSRDAPPPPPGVGGGEAPLSPRIFVCIDWKARRYRDKRAYVTLAKAEREERACNKRVAGAAFGTASPAETAARRVWACVERGRTERGTAPEFSFARKSPVCWSGSSYGGS